MAKRALIIPFTAKSSPLIITTGQPSGLPNGQAGVPYASAVTTSGGAQPATWVANSGTSAWITLSPGGNVTGTPPTSGPATLNATATDQLGAPVSGSWSFTIAPAVTPSGPNPIAANIDYAGLGSIRGLAMTQDGVPVARGFTKPSSLESGVALTASGWPAADFAVVLIEGQRVQSWMVGTWKCGFSGTGNETLSAYGSCTVTKTSAAGNPNVTFNLTTNGISAGQIVGNYALGFIVTNTGVITYSGTMVAGNAGGGDVGYLGLSAIGTLSPSVDPNGHTINNIYDGSSQFELNIASGASLGSTYFTTISLTGTFISGTTTKTLAASSASFNFGGGSSNWIWTGELGLIAGNSYAVSYPLSSSGAAGATGIYAYIPAYGANAATSKHQLYPLWTNEAIGLFGQMAAIRYMQPSNVINNNSACTSVNRTKPVNTVGGVGNTGTGEGYSQEFFASFSSACAAVHWMNVPIGADDTYYASAFSGVATFMAFAGGTGKCPGLVIEIGNELWNGAGAGESSALNALANAYNSANPGVLNYDSTVNQVTLSYRYLALRLHDLTVAAQTQFGSANVGVNGPVRIAFMTQAASGGWSTFIPTVLNFLEHQYAGLANQWVHVLGADTYCYRNNTSVPADGTNWEGTSAAPATIQAEWQRYAQYGALLNANEGIKLWCLRYGMKYYSYEGTSPGRIDPGLPDHSVSAIGAAIVDPGMNATTAYLAQQKLNAGVDMLVNYSSGVDTGTEAPAPSYCWDVLDTSVETGGSPRFQALTSYASGSIPVHRNQINGSNQSFAATEYADNTAAMSATNPTLTNYSGSGLFGPYQVAWVFQVTSAGANTYNISMTYTGSGSVNVYLDGQEVATSVSVPSGGGTVTLASNRALAAGFHSLEIGTGTSQPVTPSLISFQQSAAPQTFTPSNLTYLGSFLINNGDGTARGATAMSLGLVAGSPPANCQAQTLFVSNQSNTVNSNGMFSVYLPLESKLYNGSGVPSNTPISAGGNTANNYIAPVSSASNICAVIGSSAAQTYGNGAHLGGSYYDSANNRLLVSYFWYYPGGPGATYNVVSITPDLNLANLKLNLQVTGTWPGYTNGVNPATVIDGASFAGAWGPVASQYQSALGGTTLASVGGISNNAREGMGPIISCFSPGNLPLTQGTAQTANVWAFYGLGPVSGFTNSTWDWYQTTTGLYGQSAFNALPTSQTWSWEDTIGTIFAPANYNSVIIVGLHGTGPYMYGYANTNQSVSGKPDIVDGGAGGTFTGQLVAGSNQIAVSGLVGNIPVDTWVAVVDSNGFAAQTSGTGDWAAHPFARVASYSGGVITLSTATPTNNLANASMVSVPGQRCYCYSNLPNPGAGGNVYPMSLWMWSYSIPQLLSGNMTPYSAVAIPLPKNQSDATLAWNSGRGHGHATVDLVNKRLYMVIGNRVAGNPEIGVWSWT